MGKFKKPDYLKRIQNDMRNERIQNMKKPSVIMDKTKYDRKVVNQCDLE